MLKEKWDASLERGLDEGFFKHRHDVHDVKDFPGKRGWVGVFCPARVEGKVGIVQKQRLYDFIHLA